MRIRIPLIDEENKFSNRTRAFLKFQPNTLVEENIKAGGGVLRQWRLGIRHARGIRGRDRKIKTLERVRWQQELGIHHAQGQAVERV